MLDFIDFSFPLFMGYAELHYHLRFLYPRYYLKQPEIIADCPLRVIQEQENKLPILIIIKDSDKYPIKLLSIKVQLEGQADQQDYFFEPNKQLKQAYYSEIVYLSLAEISVDQKLQIKVEMSIECAGKVEVICQDNYPGLEKAPFNCFYSALPLPYPPNWYAGEPHYHSIFTNDQVEFGADIASSQIMAKAMGLDWFFVTDHSYDLDDAEGNYLQNDADLPQWQAMKKACKLADSETFRVIHGEEVSIGNHRRENIHLLLLNREDFIAGSGDSAERWFRNKPQNLLSEIEAAGEQELMIAAHPADPVPLMQKLTLRRGSWDQQDFDANNIQFLQFINSAEPAAIRKAVSQWSKLLATGKKYFILAGNDAHGNFNLMRQIGKPFTQLFSSHKQIFGFFHTVFCHPQNDPIAGIKGRQIIVSNGPFLNFYLQVDQKRFNIGSTISAEKAVLHYQTASTKEFGAVKAVWLYLGRHGEAESKIIAQQDQVLVLQELIYLRMSLQTENGFIALTNPIFIQNS